MQIYGIALEKGGVGKTSVAVNLAAAFSKVNLRVLLIDLDAQAHATSWVGIAPETVRPEDSMLGIVQGRPLKPCTRPAPAGFDVLPAHSAMSSLPVQVAGALNSGLFLLQDAITQASMPSHPYDIIVLDLAPARGPVLATALSAMTRCIAPVQPEDLVLQSLRALTDSVRAAQRVNPRLRGLSVLRNRYAPRSSGDQIYDATLRETYAPSLLQTIIPVRAALRDAAGMHQTVFAYSGGDAPEARNLFLNLVEELITLDGGA